MDKKRKTLAERMRDDDAPFKFVDGEETKKSDNFTIYKADEDKRLVFGWASIAITVDGTELEDRQHDMIDPEDLEDAAYEYVLNFRDTGEEHLPGYRKKGKLVESCVLTKEKQKAMGIPDGVMPVGWWIGFKIEDDDTWSRVKNGTYKMFSIEGKAQRIPVEKARKNYEEFPSYSMWLEENLDATMEEQKAAKAWYKVNKAQPFGCGVLVIQDGKILTGTRKDHHGICGPGGHIEAGESPEQAARREAAEEFGILCNDLKPLGIQDGGRNGTSAVFLCTDFSGKPRTDEEEMTDPEWRSLREINHYNQGVFPPFLQSLQLLPKERVAKTFNEVLKFNPYHDSLGRFSTSSGYASFTTHTKDPNKQHMADMAVARMKQNAAAQAAAQAAAKPAAPAQPPAPPKPTKNFDSKGFADQDDADFHQLYNRKNYFQQQQLTAAQKKAADDYVNPNTEPGSLYNVAQNVNWAMVNGNRLSPKHQQVHDNMMSAMHNVGYNINLTRYDHDDMINSVLQNLGAGSDYTKMSQNQLKKALVGQSFGENKFVSGSVNDLKTAPSNVQSLFQNRAVKVNYQVPAKTKGLLMPIGSGGDQGEMVLAPTNGTANKIPKIVDVKFTGKRVYRNKTGRYYPQVEIDIGWD